MRHIGRRDLDRIHRSLLLRLLDRLLLESRLLRRLWSRLPHRLITTLLVLRLCVCRPLSRIPYWPLSRTIHRSLSLSKGRLTEPLNLLIATLLSLSGIVTTLSLPSILRARIV